MPARKLVLVAPAALLFAFCLLLAWNSPAMAHGVEISAGAGKSVVVSGMYDDGEPMSYANVKVLNPAGKTHQVGNSDATGCFAFLPSQPGKWQITFADGMGHRAETIWQEKQAKAASQASPAPPSSGQAKETPKWARAVWGLSALFWLSGFVFWLKGRSKERQA